MIEFGDTEYFTLLRLRDELKYRQYDRLDLVSLDRLRNEIDTKIKQIELEYYKNKK